MLRNVNELRQSGVYATDGEVGDVEDVYFDDRDWVVRYLVVNTGGWLSGRRVLISPVAIGQLDWPKRKLAVLLTHEQIRRSPDVETNPPVSRQQESELAAYYTWPVYWGVHGLVGAPGGAWAGYGTPAASLEMPHAGERRSAGDPHLRSAREVIGYALEARDGEVGHVEDFLADDADWTLRYVVVDTRNWIPGKQVLLPPSWVRTVDWESSRVQVDLERDVLKNSPEYDPALPVTREYERRLFDYYGRPAYWDQPAVAGIGREAD